MRRKRFGQRIAVVALIGLVLGLIAALWPREPRLMERATFISRTDGWNEGDHFNRSIGIHWLTDETLLVDRLEGLPKKRAIYRRHIKTGQEDRLAGLTKLWGDSTGENIDSQALSPDGRWLLTSYRWESCELMAVDGSSSRSYPSKADDCYRQVLWMADSRHWLENYRVNVKTSLLLLHDTAHPELTEELPLGDRADIFSELEVVTTLKQAIALTQIPDTPYDGNTDFSVTPSATVSKLSLDAKTKPDAEYHLSLPRRRQNYRLIMSPQGDKIAWEITAAPVDIRPEWLKPFTPFFKPKSQEQTELWVSNIDGSHLHEIGRLPASSNTETTQSLDGEMPDLSVMWLPSGKRLSFEYQNALYTVPVE